MKISIINIFLLIEIVYLPLFSQPENKFQVSFNENGEMVLVIDSQFHIDYGFAYPITYKLQLLQNNSNLTVFKRCSTKNDWVQFNENTKNDFFNGIETARFEYNLNWIYLSVAFSSISDTIFIKIINEIGNNVLFEFLEICKYYDNRAAVVTTTADDLGGLSVDFRKAFQSFRSRNLWLSCAAITSRFNSESWADIQGEVDSGLVEIDSHSRSHLQKPYDLEYEIIGSKSDIINNLNLPSLYKNGQFEYVYSYIYPYGTWGYDIDKTAGNGKYLICRKVNTGEFNYTAWNSDFQLYNRVGVVYEVGPDYGGYGISDLNILINTFDETVGRVEIYHFSIHPNGIEDHGDWEKSYIHEHLDYISNHKNIWYVGFGHLYLYHLLNDLTSKIENISLSIKIFL